MFEFPTELIPGAGCKFTDRIAGPWSVWYSYGIISYRDPRLELHASVYHTSQRVFITLRSLRPKYRFAGGFKSRGSRIPYLYPKRLLRIFLYYFFSCTEDPRTPRARRLRTQYIRNLHTKYILCAEPDETSNRSGRQVQQLAWSIINKLAGTTNIWKQYI